MCLCTSYACMHLCLSVCMSVCLSVSLSVCLYVCMHLRTYVCTYECIFAIHQRLPTHTHTHTHTHIQQQTKTDLICIPPVQLLSHRYATTRNSPHAKIFFLRGSLRTCLLSGNASNHDEQREHKSPPRLISDMCLWPKLRKSNKS